MLNRVCSVLIKLTVLSMLVIIVGPAGCSSGRGLRIGTTGGTTSSLVGATNPTGGTTATPGGTGEDHHHGQRMSNSIGTWVAVLKDLVNIAFFVIAAAVAVLTYRRVRDTLLAPMRTEVFKAQLRELTEAYTFLRDTRDVGLDPFDLGSVVYLNAQAMMDAYVASTFPGKLLRTEEFEKKRKDNVAGAFIEAGTYGKRWRYPSPVTHQEDSSREHKSPPWSEYKHDCVVYTKQFVERERELDRLKGSPFLPSAVQVVLQELRRKVEENLHIIGKLMTELARELPMHYPDPQDVYNSDLAWVHNKYNEVKVELEEPVEKGLAFVRDYLSADAVFRPK